MTVKTLILGAAAGTLAVAGAHAADLPIAPEPVDYVRVCDAQGTGFFYIPGTETCLRVGGRVRAEIRGGNMKDANAGFGSPTGNNFDFRARGYVRLDARTETEYGLLRTYTDAWFTANTAANGANGGIGAGVILWDAFVQLGGFTAGRTGSFFDFYTGDAWGSILNQGFSDQHTTLFGYTAAFGNGMSASVSLEDGTLRRGTSGHTYGGHELPDFVANLRVDQGWGSAQIMGALHDVNSNDTRVSSELGYAVAAGVTFNLPMIAAGDSISFQAAYAQGASQYVSTNLNLDAVQTGLTLDKATAWGIGGGFTHFWTPMWSTSVSTSYAALDVNAAELKQIAAQGNLVWHPVGGLDIGVEVEYLNSDFNAAAALADSKNLNAVFRVQRTF